MHSPPTGQAPWADEGADGAAGAALPGDGAAADDALAAMVNLVVVLADNKYRLGRHLSEWAVGAPSLEVGVACAAIAQGELGQARVLYPLLGPAARREAGPEPDRSGQGHQQRPAQGTPPETATGGRGPGAEPLVSLSQGQLSGPEAEWQALQQLPFPGEVDPARRARGYHVSALDAPFPTWPHAVAALLLVDTATTVMLEALDGASYEALARRVPRMLEEEAFHWDFADGRVRELARVPGGAAQLQARVDASATELLCWFGPPGEPGVAALRRHGLLSRTNQELRQAWLDRVVPLLADAGVTLHLPQDPDPARATRRLTAELPWTRWNRLQRRLDPAPAHPATTPAAATTR